MSIPDYQTLLLPVLEIASKGEPAAPVAEVDIAAKFSLTDQDREQMLPRGKQRVLHNLGIDKEAEGLLDGLLKGACSES